MEITSFIEKQQTDQVISHFETFCNGTTTVEWVENSADVGVDVTVEKEFLGSNDYKYPVPLRSIVVRATRSDARDLPRGERVIDGFVTLAADGIPSPDGQVRAFSAVWAAKGRGLSWVIGRGVILEDVDGKCVHGSDAPTAMAALRWRRLSM